MSILGVSFLVLVLAGCHNAIVKTQEPLHKPESSQEVISALQTVTEGLTNKNLTQADLKNLAGQMQKDPQARSAVSQVNAAFGIQEIGVKYCPVDGQRFSAKLDICPVHKVKLEVVK